ncbi:MAG: hypothetical protein P8Y99_02905 [Calditrichaceae bacterium]
MYSNLKIVSWEKTDIIMMCAVCSSVETERGWLPYALALQKFDLEAADREERISHALCRNCAIEKYGPEIAHLFDEE